MLGWRPRDLDLAYLPVRAGKGIAQYTSDPVFRQPASSPSRACERSGPPTPAALRALVQATRSYPGSFRDEPALAAPASPPCARFLEIYSRPSLTWDDLAWLRERTKLPIVLKGILHPDDARLAVEHGVDGIVVSNHGGRQVDGAIGVARRAARCRRGGRRHGSRSCSTAASAAAPTRSRRSRSARRRS